VSVVLDEPGLHLAPVPTALGSAVATARPTLPEIAARIAAFLQDGQSAGADTDALRSELRIVAQRLRTDRPGLRLHLVAHTEPYDGSVAHDVVIRDGGEVLVIGTAGGVDLPWPLRGVMRASEQRVLRVNGQKLDVGGVVACLDFLFDDRQTLQTLVHSCLVAEALEEEPVALSREEVQQAVDAFRRAKGLLTAEQTARWLAERALSPEEFSALVRRTAAVAALRRRIAPPARVRAAFEKDPQRYATVLVAWAQGATGEMAGAELQEVSRARAAGRPAGVSEWSGGSVPPGIAGVTRATVGVAVQVVIDGEPGTAVVVDRRGAVLDGATSDLIERELFGAWLAERRATADIEWHWGDALRTGRAAGA
jgi:putative peptide maturation system protein